MFNQKAEATVEVISHHFAKAAVLKGPALSAANYVDRFINRIRLVEIRIETPRWKLILLTISEK